MSARDAIRAQLEALMGPMASCTFCVLVHLLDYLDFSDHEAAANMTFTDEKVCRSYMVASCPHELFSNTVRLVSFSTAL
jgi:hypothetical protein